MLPALDLVRPENFNAENKTNNEIYNEQLNEEIDKENIDDPATSSTIVENKNPANDCETCKKIGPLGILGKNMGYRLGIDWHSRRKGGKKLWSSYLR